MPASFSDVVVLDWEAARESSSAEVEICADKWVEELEPELGVYSESSMSYTRCVHHWRRLGAPEAGWAVMHC